MRVKLRSQNMILKEEARASVERRLRFVLGRFASRINRVTVDLAKLNWPEREGGTFCRIVVGLVRSSRIRVEDTDTDLREVVARATERLGQMVRRELERQHEERKERSAPIRRQRCGS
jgi:ribosome-associated translation inhibitor RaiA